MSDKPATTLEIRVNCSITRNYGPESVTFGIQFDAAIDNIAQYSNLFERAYRRVDLAHKDYAANILPGVSMPITQKQHENEMDRTEGKNGTGKFPVRRVFVEKVADGKPYYKVDCGPFGKYGVRVWADALPAEIPTPTAETPTKLDEKWLAIVQFRNGKPQKVIEFELA